MKLLGVQLAIAWENKAANFASVDRLLSDVKLENNSMVVLPEMFATGFTMNTAAMAESYGGETEEFLGKLARKFDVYVVGGASMRGRDGLVRNKALVFSPAGELVSYYAKMKPFTLGGEREFYAAGQRIATFQWSDCKVCPFICYDLRFPELFRQATAAHRPELFVVIASFPEKRIMHWVRLLQARAIENQAYVIGVNRVGTDPYYKYTGRSIIVEPGGEIIADAGEQEGMVSANLDLPNLLKYRAGLPFLDDLTMP